MREARAEVGSGPGLGSGLAPGLGSGPGFHTVAWMVWLAAALAPTVLTRNPWYLALLLAAAAGCRAFLGRGTVEDRTWGSFLRFGLVFAAVALLFNLLFGGAGRTVLARLPAWSWEVEIAGRTATLLRLGGPVTLEALVHGLLTAGALIGILLVLATFNSRVDPYELMRRMPRFLDRSATVASIAMAFVPQLMQAQKEVREAMALRGRPVRRLRDLPPLFLALLAEGLERSINLAASMEARGFGRRQQGAGDGARGRAAQGRRETAVRLALTAALVLLVVGAALRADPERGLVGWGLVAAGGGLLAAALAAVGRGVKRSRYRRETWRRRDSLLTALSLLVLTTYGLAWSLRRSLLYYQPYPRAQWPSFEPWLAAATLALAAPAALLAASRRRAAAQAGPEPGLAPGPPEGDR